MLITEAIQLITSVVALILGVAYVTGGLIVNLHLAHYGVTEYQILRVKYLVVGLIFLVTNLVTIFIAFLASSLSFTFLSFAPNSVLAVLAIISLLASGVLLGRRLFAKKIAKSRVFFPVSLGWFVLYSSFSWVFTVYFILRQMLLGASDLYSAIWMIPAILLGTLAVFGQLYFYARFIYGDPSQYYDPIGMGVPVAVKLAVGESNLRLLEHMGIPTLPPDLTDKISLLDESDSHYIIGVDTEKGLQVSKIAKELVKGIVYLAS
jgi:hypothetical protein